MESDSEARAPNGLLVRHQKACVTVTSVIYLIVYEKACCKMIKYSSVIYIVLVVMKNNTFYYSILFCMALGC